MSRESVLQDGIYGYIHVDGYTHVNGTWRRHLMETFSALLTICAGNSPVPGGEFPTQRPVTRGFDVFFDLRLNKRLSKQSWGWWFESLSHPLWRHLNVWTYNEIWYTLREGMYRICDYYTIGDTWQNNPFDNDEFFIHQACYSGKIVPQKRSQIDHCINLYHFNGPKCSHTSHLCVSNTSKITVICSDSCTYCLLDFIWPP